MLDPEQSFQSAFTIDRQGNKHRAETITRFQRARPNAFRQTRPDIHRHSRMHHRFVEGLFAQAKARSDRSGHAGKQDIIDGGAGKPGDLPEAGQRNRRRPPTKAPAPATDA